MGVAFLAVLNSHFVFHAGQSAQLSLDNNAVVMGILNDLLGQSDVFLEGLGGGVDHNGGETAVNAALAQLEAVTVVQVQSDGDFGIFNDGSLDQLHEVRVVGVGTSALGNLQDDGRLQLAGSFGDALNDLHVVDVESADGVAAVVGLLEHFGCCYESHWNQSFHI